MFTSGATSILDYRVVPLRLSIELLKSGLPFMSLPHLLDFTSYCGTPHAVNATI